MDYLIKPWAHQLKVIEAAKDADEYALFLEMGAGKTASTINICRHKFVDHKRVLKTLVVCPIIMVRAWEKEWKLHSKVGKHVVALTGTGPERVKRLKKHLEIYPNAIVVVNYEALLSKGVLDAVTKFSPEVIIADESQRLKNHKSKRAQVVTALGSKALYRYILTGTPILNNPMDIFSQYLFLDQGKTFGHNFYSFRAKYFEDRNVGMPSFRHFPNWQMRRGSADELQKKIYKKAMRIKKEDCMELPPLVRTTYEVELSKEQRKVYDEMAQEFIAYLGDKACVAQNALTKILRLQQVITGFAKLDDKTVNWFTDVPRLRALNELVEDILPNKVIIWASFRDNYERIMLELQGHGPILQLVGGMSDKDRTEAVELFQKCPKHKIIVCNQKAAGLGVTLTAASYMIYFSRTYSLEDDLQSEARAHRGGSEVHEKITRIDLVAPKTVDEAILKALSSKQNIAENILTLRNHMQNIF
jgi:SNF2 family DNA or RNA helicase